MTDLNSQLWTGRSVLMGTVKREWQDTDIVLSHFDKRHKKAINECERFVKEGISWSKRPTQRVKKATWVGSIGAPSHGD